MKANLKLILLSILFTVSFSSFSQQTQEIKLNPDKVKKLTPIMEFKHGGPEAFAAWKSTNKMLYAQEMWYYTESFYIKRNVNSGNLPSLDETGFDVTRFENQRKASEESTVVIPGFKDVIVLLPETKLIYKVK